MNKLKHIFLLFMMPFGLWAQEEIVHSVYFDFDKYNIREDQKDLVLNFIKALDSTMIESISIYGYTDDRGKEDYNFILSTNRANAIKNKLIENGITNKIIVSIEGKGRIMVDDDLIDNLPEVRSKNRRVDVVANLKEIKEEELQIPGVYHTLTKDNIVGDRIYLKNLLFERGSSKLTNQSKRELNKMVVQLNRNKNFRFEIQGHVCCTPSYHKEAIDRDTRKRELSENRAKAVYNYLIYRRISKSRMTYKGYGTSQPLGKDPRLDRRVEFLITKK
ncbi:MAG: OmpA family protein [Flavobacteriaceae bacterium]